MKILTHRHVGKGTASTREENSARIHKCGQETIEVQWHHDQVYPGSGGFRRTPTGQSLILKIFLLFLEAGGGGRQGSPPALKQL